MAITRAADKINKSVQEIQNLSFDADYNVSAREMLAEDPNGNLSRVQADEQGHLHVLAELIPMLRSILFAIANPSYVDKSANAIRNQVQSGTVTTVTTVTNPTNVGSFTADHLQRQANMTAWAANIRSLIT